MPFSLAGWPNYAPIRPPSVMYPLRIFFVIIDIGLHLFNDTSQQPRRGWHSETIDGPKRIPGLTYLLTEILKHKRYNSNMYKYLAQMATLIF